MATESFTRMTADELAVVIDGSMELSQADQQFDAAEIARLFKSETHGSAEPWLLAQSLTMGILEKVKGREAALCGIIVCAFQLGWRAREALAEREALERMMNAEG